MGKVAVRPSARVADFLRTRRRHLGLSLRDVEERTRRQGQVIPFSTLARLEKGEFDPGLRRLHALFRLYDVGFEVAGELLDMEEFAGEWPAETAPEKLYEDGLNHWKAGNIRQGLAHLLALRAHPPKNTASTEERQKWLLTLAVIIGSLGRYRLSRQIVDELILAPPHPNLVVRVFVQAAVCWHWLGSNEAALGFLTRAEAHVGRDDHKERAWVFHERASTLASLGQFDEANGALEQALAEYRTAGNDYGESRALAVRVRLASDRGDWRAALEAATAAHEHARLHDFGRLRTMRTIDIGRAHVALGDRHEGVTALNLALSAAITTDDHVCRFYAHYYLWQAHLDRDDLERAEIELKNARYYVRFVDDQSPETVEIRDSRAED
jgi:tetratricopeptide (TPR) repeat protein